MNRALCIGINYPGTSSSLEGCVNDAIGVASFLGDMNYYPSMMLDGEATRANMLMRISTLVETLRSGDTGVLAYSGHGSWAPDMDGDEPDRRDEVLCPVDFEDGENLITDDELRGIFLKLAKGATLVFISDSCHSGTVFRFSKERDAGLPWRAKFIPPSHFIKDPAKYLAMERLYGQPSRATSNAPLPGVVHYSGCGDNEYSADATFDGKPNGALTYYLLRAFRKIITMSGGGGSYGSAFKLLRTWLPSSSYPQTPKLNASKELRQARLLGP